MLENDDEEQWPASRVHVHISDSTVYMIGSPGSPTRSSFFPHSSNFSINGGVFSIANSTINNINIGSDQALQIVNDLQGGSLTTDAGPAFPFSQYSAIRVAGKTETAVQWTYDPGAQETNIRDIMARLDKLFHDDKLLYTKFLAYRDASAQWLLDLLQDLLDYDSATINRRRLFKALIRLSADSKLYPRCCILTGLQHEELVAGGAFGDVYMASLSGQRVGVKIMRVFKESDIETLLKGFGREALIWRQLSHPNLLPFYGLYMFRKRLCLVSPWMEKGHIRGFLKKETYCTDCLLSLILDVVLGLEYLHAMGVVHADLKGDNIFVTPSRRACLADFGFASIISSVSSIQFTDSSTPTQGDIYGFGCVVYELLTGTAPFPELRTDAAVAVAVLQGRRPPHPPSCLGMPALEGLWNLLQDCWDQSPERRPTASQVVERLMGDDIQTTKVESLSDWDDTFTSRFRRHFLGQQPLPSVKEFERMIFGDVIERETEPEVENMTSGLSGCTSQVAQLEVPDSDHSVFSESI
ncbi:kinase-like domain-containing protein [Mycena alexandri]|uniref:Kinase-like domain-containing protein n=1 Tax=Mycena alexandri TaxID=1745969 RepID=A0AAD6SZR5_9AGAR|nr:kinase-like domain-containing protein [Mycena alexandri]